MATVATQARLRLRWFTPLDHPSYKQLELLDALEGHVGLDLREVSMSSDQSVMSVKVFDRSKRRVKVWRFNYQGERLDDET